MCQVGAGGESKDGGLNAMALGKLQIDVLVLTAADGEDTALRAVEEGAIGAWSRPDPEKPVLAIRRFRRVDGGEVTPLATLKVAREFAATWDSLFLDS